MVQFFTIPFKEVLKYKIPENFEKNPEHYALSDFLNFPWIFFLTITWDLKIWKWQLSLKIYAMVKFKDPVSIGIVCYLKENAMTGLLKYVLKVQSNVPVL